jgi:hypothetical protein
MAFTDVMAARRRDSRRGRIRFVGIARLAWPFRKEASGGGPDKHRPLAQKHQPDQHRTEDLMRPLLAILRPDSNSHAYDDDADDAGNHSNQKAPSSRL